MDMNAGVSHLRLQGGRSTAYKNSILQKSNRTELYQKDGAALFRVQGLRPDCIRAIQVHLVSLGKTKIQMHVDTYFDLFSGNASTYMTGL